MWQKGEREGMIRGKGRRFGHRIETGDWNRETNRSSASKRVM